MPASDQPPKPENEFRSEDVPAETQPENSEPPRKQPGGVGFLFRQLVYVVMLIVDSFKGLFLKFINIRDSTDIRKTINNIHGGIEIKGYNIWILIASAVLACIGLDTNSTAVIIGAMLISPLMSPILGIGLSIGMNDRNVLLRSAYNFGIAVAISLGTAILYFLVSPLANETPEILSRTHPTLLDVGVGFFGGVAGIVAGSRRDITNAIPGVAIATALMPPLCVAGFGLATFQLNYFAGAFYLFFLNVVFISLATFLIVRFLNFPLKSEITLNLLKNFRIGVVIFVVLILVPAVYLFVDVITDQRESYRIQAFVNDKFPKTEFIVEQVQIIEPDEKDSTAYLMLTIAGTQYIPHDTVDVWQEELGPRYDLDDLELRLLQSGSDPNDRDQIMQATNAEINRRFDDYEQDRKQWLEDQEEIARLKAELESVRSGRLPMMEIRDDIQAMVPECVAFDLGEIRICNLADSSARRDPSKDEEALMVLLTWPDSLPAGRMEDRKQLLIRRIKEKYNITNIRLVDSNTPEIVYEDGSEDAE